MNLGVEGFGLRVTGCGLRVADYGLRVAGCGLRVAGCGLRVTGCGLRVAGYGLRVTGCGMRVTGYGVQVTVLSYGFKSIEFHIEPRNVQRTTRNLGSLLQQLHYSIIYIHHFRAKLML